MSSIEPFKSAESAACVSHNTVPDRISPENSPSPHQPSLLPTVLQANQLLFTRAPLSVTLPQVLACLGQATGGDRTYIYQHQPDGETGQLAMHLRFAWKREGLADQVPSAPWEALVYQRDGLERWLTIFTQRQPLHGTRATFPMTEQALLQQSQIQSWLMVPIFVEQHLWGVLGLDQGQGDRLWSDTERTLVQMVADNLGGAIARHPSLDALQTSEMRLQKLANTLPGMLFQVDLSPNRQGTFSYVSEGCQQILGLSAATLTGTALEAMVHPADRSKVRMAMLQSAQSLQPLTLDWRIQLSEGTEKRVQVSATPEPLGNDGVRWHGVLFDISDHQQPPQEQASLQAIAEARETDEQATQEKLCRSNAILQAQQDAVPGGILVLDENCNLASFNQKFSQLWRLPDPLMTTEEVRPLLEILCDHLEDGAEFLAKIDYLHRHPEEKSQEEVVLKDGRIFDRFSAPVKSQEGTFLGRIWYFQDITERKQAELKIKESYALLNGVINGTDDLIFVKDKQGKYLLANGAMTRTFRDRPTSLVGQDDTGLYPLDVAADIQRRDHEILASGIPQTFEQQVPIQGELRTFLTSKTPYRDEQGRIIGLVGISRDVTDIQRVREERDRFFQLSSDMMCTAGFDGYLKQINPSFSRLLGYSHEELLTTPLLRFIHPSDRPATEQALQQGMAGDQVQSFENRWQCQNGDYRWFSWSVIPYPAGQMFYATARDITDRRQTEAALQESEQRFRDVTEAAGEYVWEINAEGHYTFLTDKVQTVKGYRVSELLGRSLFAQIPPEDATPVQRSLQIASSHKTSFRVEHRDITPDGSIVWEEISGLPILDGNGTLLGFRGTGLNITEKKQAEASLRLFKQAVESSSDAICITDADFEYVYHNQAFAELFDLSPTPEGVAEFVRSDRAYADPQVSHIVASTIRQGRPYAGEVMMRSDQGRTIPALLRANVIRDQAGNIVGTIQAYTDISDRKSAEARLQLQEEFLRSIYDGTAHRIFALNVLPDGEIVYSGHNRAAEEATGWTSESVVGLTPAELFGPEEGEAIQRICQHCIEHQAPITQEEHITLGGKASWVLSTFNPLRDYAGRIHRIVGTSFDITSLKQAQAELQQQAHISTFRSEIDSLLTRGEDLRTMLQGCCQVIVEYIEAAFARIWTFNVPEQVLELQASAGIYTHIDGGHARVPIGQFKIGLIASEKRPHITNDVQTDPRLGDRDWAEREGLVSFAGYPLIVDDRLLGVLALFARHPLPEPTLKTLGMVADEIALGVKRKQTEIQLQRSETQLRQQAQELQLTLQELQQAQSHLVQSEKMSSLGQLVAGVAHEINNPVNFIYGNLTHARTYTEDLLHLVSLYQSHYPSPHPAIQEEAEAMDLEFVMEDLPKLLNSMKVGAERIQSIVSSLRIFSRMDEAEMKAVDLHDGIESTLMILQNRLKSRGDRPEIVITRDYGELPLVECYAGQLNQVFMNILSNAIDALEETFAQRSPTAPPPTIQIQTRRRGNHQVEIQIRDNGPGIPADRRARLFDPFFTTKPIGKGTGMGLSISYQIVTEKHRGRLTCESEVGQGTTFTLTIPLKQSGWESK